MGRAARLKRERKAAGNGKPEKRVQLVSPFTAHFQSFIYGNAVIREEMLKRQVAHYLGMAPAGVTDAVIERAGRAGLVFDSFMVEQDSARGQHLVLCGAGPSLAEHAAEWCPKGDQVWACNSALPYLLEHGYKVTRAITVDQTAEMLNEWRAAPDVEYLLATTCHPHLTEFLLEQKRRVRFFHNFVGIKMPPVAWDGHAMNYEDWMYVALYPSTLRAGGGLNTATRAIDVALFMGFDHITLLGADNALRADAPMPACTASRDDPVYLAWLREHVIMHADGGHALASGATATIFTGEIDGRLWVTKPDMAISALYLARLEKSLGGMLALVGDTLPNAIKGKSEEFLARLPVLLDSAGKPIPMVADGLMEALGRTKLPGSGGAFTD